MSSAFAIASSGLQAAQLRLDSSAHNVANMNTPGFRRQAVEQQDGQRNIESAVQPDTVFRDQPVAGQCCRQHADHRIGGDARQAQIVANRFAGQGGANHGQRDPH